jgi:hypothetical protein
LQYRESAGKADVSHLQLQGKDQELMKGMLLTEFATSEIRNLKLARYYLAFMLLAALMQMLSWFR